MFRSFRRLFALGAFVALGAGARPLSAQLPLLPTTPRYQQIVHLAQDGYGDSARAMISHTLTTLPATDSTYAEALFTAALVSNNGDDTSRNLSRIVVEFANSGWADKALLRLAQLSYGSGNLDEAIIRVTRLMSDYPDSPVMPSAALWGARAAFERNKLQLGCDWLTRALARIGDDVEVKNQLQFAHQRCNLSGGVQFAPYIRDSLRQGPPPSDTTKPAPPTAPPPAPVAPPPATSTGRGAAAASPWRVQTIAVADKATVRRFVQKLEAAGFKTWLVAGPKGLTKVQAGPFATRAAAAAAIPRIKKAVGGAPFVTGAP